MFLLLASLLGVKGRDHGCGLTATLTRRLLLRGLEKPLPLRFDVLRLLRHRHLLLRVPWFVVFFYKSGELEFSSVIVLQYAPQVAKESAEVGPVSAEFLHSADVDRCERLRGSGHLYVIVTCSLNGIW